MRCPALPFPTRQVLRGALFCLADVHASLRRPAAGGAPSGTALADVSERAAAAHDVAARLETYGCGVTAGVMQELGAWLSQINYPLR